MVCSILVGKINLYAVPFSVSIKLMFPPNCFVRLLTISHPRFFVIFFGFLIPTPLSLIISIAVFSSNFVIFLIIFLFGADLSGNACFMAFMVSSSMIRSSGVMTSIVRFKSSSTYVSNSTSTGSSISPFVWLSWSRRYSSRLIF